MKRSVFLFLISALFFSSCLGMKTNIELSKNGSGKIDVEFTVSKEAIEMADNFGGGDAQKPPIPIGKEDFQRSVAGIEGLTVTDFSVKEDNINKIFLAKMSFTKMDALLAYLNAQNESAVYKTEGKKNILTLSFARDDQPVDPSIKDIFPMLFAGYYMDFSLSLPEKCEVVYLDAQGKKINQPAIGSASIKNKTIQYVVPMSDLVSETDPVTVQLTW